MKNYWQKKYAWDKNRTPEQKEEDTRALYIVIFVIIGAIFTGMQWENPVDDAYVSFVYAKNLLNGNGLAFNPGERVEGYSNFFWVMILWAAGHAQEIPSAAQGLGFLLGMANIILVWMVAKRSGLGKASHIAAGLYATDLSASVWNVEGLETPLYVFLILMSIYLYLRGRARGAWAVPALFAAMTRPEGAAVFGAVAVHRIVILWRSKSKPAVDDLVAAAFFVIGFGLYNAWRITYFGSLLPNTFHARGGLLGPITGAPYIAIWLWKGRTIGALAMVFLIALGLKRGFKSELGLSLSWLAVGLLIILATGGDWMPNGRFLVPILPFLYLMASNGLMQFKSRNYYYIFVSVMLAANIYGQSAYGRSDSFDKRWARNQASFYMPVSEWLVKQGARGKKVVLSDVGYITYYSEIYAIDTLGLTNLHLARVKGGSAFATDVDYVLELKPDYIIRMERDYDGVKLGHTEFDRKVVGDARFESGFKEVAVIPGYEATERAITDFKLRRYTMSFHIYARQTN